jgi:hypothetical protein
MAGFATVPDAVRAAGKTAADASTALRGADCGAPVSDLTAALPGSATADAAGDYARNWSQTFTGWCDQAGRHATNLTQAAANYASTEQGTTHGFDPDAGRVRGPH